MAYDAETASHQRRPCSEEPPITADGRWSLAWEARGVVVAMESRRTMQNDHAIASIARASASASTSGRLRTVRLVTSAVRVRRTQ